MHVFASLPVILRMSPETSGSSSARSMLTWVSVRQKEGGRGVGGSVNQNNTLSWCEIKLLTSLQTWTARSHFHTLLQKLSLFMPNPSQLYFPAGLLCFSTHSCLNKFMIAFVSLSTSTHTLLAPLLSLSATPSPTYTLLITHSPTHQRRCQISPPRSAHFSEHSWRSNR